MMNHRLHPLPAAVALLLCACGGSSGDTTPPVPPALVSTLPASPNVDSRPLLRGNTEPMALVRLYAETNCAGPSVGLGLADGNGRFTAAVTTPLIGNADTELQATAMDAAGNVSNCSASSLTYRSLVPGVSFAESAGSPFSVGDQPWSVAVADLDGDGNLDIVTANNGSDNVSVLFDNGNGTFTEKPFPVGINTEPQSVAIADLDGDGNLDLVTANNTGHSVSVLFGDGGRSFGAPDDTPVGDFPRSVAIDDLNADGSLDVVTANDNSDDVSVLIGDGAGAGALESATHFAVGDPGDTHRPASVAIADLNDDGRPDIVTANQSSGAVSVLIGNGAGTFTPAAESPLNVGTQLLSVAIADLDGDDWLDLAVADIGSNTISVLLGNGNGTFEPEVDYDTGDARSVAIADLNGDGRPDFVTANQLLDNVSVLLGNGDGTFESRIDFAVSGDAPRSVAIADLNRDGRPDLAVGNQFDDTVSVLLNQP